jgi:hypothetical protein
LILPDRPPIPLHTSGALALSPDLSLLFSIRWRSALSTLKIPCPLACKLMFSPMTNELTLSLNPWSRRTNLESPKQTP